MKLRKYLPIFIRDLHVHQPERSAILQLGQLNNWSDVPSAVSAPFNSVSMSASCSLLPAQLLSCGKMSSWGLGPCYWSQSWEHHFFHLLFFHFDPSKLTQTYQSTIFWLIFSYLFVHTMNINRVQCYFWPHWLQTYFKISSFMFHIRKQVIRVWNEKRDHF